MIFLRKEKVEINTAMFSFFSLRAVSAANKRSKGSGWLDLIWAIFCIFNQNAVSVPVAEASFDSSDIVKINTWKSRRDKPLLFSYQNRRNKSLDSTLNCLRVRQSQLYCAISPFVDKEKRCFELKKLRWVKGGFGKCVGERI